MPDPTYPSIDAVTHRDDALCRFLADARSAMFGDRVDLQAEPPDIAAFDQTYLSGTGLMLAARHPDVGIVGTVAYRAYDHRFAQFDYEKRRVVEVVRLFVLPAFRRSGLASRLFDALRLHAQAQQVELLYLHTHPFLHGAQDFWEARGFHVTARDEDPLWQTVHMACVVGGR